MQQNTLDIFFGTYSREYCLYFYYLMVFAFILMVIATFQSFYLFFQGEIGVTVAAINLIAPFLIYFNNRLLYSMCQGSLSP